MNIEELASAPEQIVDKDPNFTFGLSPEQYNTFQLAAVRTRFQQLKEKIPVLTKLASSTGIETIDKIEDAAPLLFQHTVYKSYPLALIERSDFTRLTRWINGLTTHDLSDVDVSECQLIDEWLQFLDDNTPLRVVHSTGTSGKLSFLPRSITEMSAYTKGLLGSYQPFGNEPDETPEKMPLIIPAYRHGFNAGPRTLDILKKALNTPEEDILTIYERMSADLMSLAGRLRTAEAKGESGKLQINEKMQEMKLQLLEQKKNAADAMEKFFRNAVDRFSGQRVWITATIPQLYEAAENAKQQGIKNVFHKRSIVQTGGGFKGNKLPDNFVETICEFVGVDKITEAYGMTETMSYMRKCPHGKFHVPPHLVPYLTNPDTGELLPREGTHTGRFGFIDLLAQSYWGGFLTGDEVTITWQYECECGRTGGPVIHEKISRLSESRGGDDKISCAGGADEAHDRAVEFLLNDVTN